MYSAAFRGRNEISLQVDQVVIVQLHDQVVQLVGVNARKCNPTKRHVILDSRYPKKLLGIGCYEIVSITLRLVAMDSPFGMILEGSLVL